MIKNMSKPLITLIGFILHNYVIFFMKSIFCKISTLYFQNSLIFLAAILDMKQLIDGTLIFAYLISNKIILERKVVAYKLR